MHCGERAPCFVVNQLFKKFIFFSTYFSFISGSTVHTQGRDEKIKKKNIFENTGSTTTATLGQINGITELIGF